MKELILNKQGLTRLNQHRILNTEIIFMAGESKGEKMPQNPKTFHPTGENANVDMATRRLEAAAKKLLQKEDLNVDLKRGAEEIVKEGGSPSSPPNEETAVESGGRGGQGGEPPTPPSGTTPEEPGDGEVNRVNLS